MRKFGSFGRCLPAAVLLLTAVLPVSAQSFVEVQPVAFGEALPTWTMRNLNEGAGGPASIDLSAVVGKRSVVFCYWIAGNRRSENVFLETQDLAEELGPNRLVFYGVVTERPGLGAPEIKERIKALKIRVPVLSDEGFRLGQHMRVQTVPNIAILDKEGKLRLAGAGSLRQTLEYKMDVEQAIRRVASTGTLGTYGSLPKYYPVKELIGQKCPDFQGTLLGNGETRRWSQMFDSGKLNVLVFWSVDCPHCKAALPELNAWLKANPGGANVVSAVGAQSEATRVKTEEYCKRNDISFPTLVDEDRQIADRYLITSTPTFILIGPDGVIDSVLLSGSADVGGTLDAKRRELVAGS